MPNYQNLKDDEVLQIAVEREQLTDDARLALDAELSRRKISAVDVESRRVETAEAEHTEKLRLWKIGYIAHWGLGKKSLGKTNRRLDPGGAFEEYDTTVWFAVLWFPVFPIATYTVRRNLERWRGLVFRSDEVAIERHPRNWEQILLTWVKCAGLLLATRLAFALWIRMRR